MLAKQFKLKSKKSIQNLLRRGKKVNTNNFYLSFQKVSTKANPSTINQDSNVTLQPILPSLTTKSSLSFDKDKVPISPQIQIEDKFDQKTNQKTPRILVSIPKKLHKPATDRKKISRRVYSVVQGFLKTNSIDAFNIMICVKNSSTLKLHYIELESEILELLNSFVKVKDAPVKVYRPYKK